MISLCDLFWYDLLSLPKVTGYNLYGMHGHKGCVRLCFRDSRLCLTYIRVCVISANLAPNRVRLIHGVDLYMSLYGNSKVKSSSKEIFQNFISQLPQLECVFPKVSEAVGNDSINYKKILSWEGSSGTFVCLFY